jgi:cytochrome c oxidase subunit 2
MSTLGFPLFPEQASTLAGRVDQLFLFLIAVRALLAALICVLIIVFAVKYRRRNVTTGRARFAVIWAWRSSGQRFRSH